MTEVTEAQRQQEIESREQYKDGILQQEVRREEAVKRVRVTRGLVLKGIAHREPIDVHELGEGAYLVIRPLTDGEFVEVQRVILGDMSSSAFEGENLKITDMVDREQRGKYLALSFALSLDNEQWTPEEIGGLPVGVPDKLYNRLAEISGFPRPAKSPSEEEKPGREPSG